MEVMVQRILTISRVLFTLFQFKLLTAVIGRPNQDCLSLCNTSVLTKSVLSADLIHVYNSCDHLFSHY